MIVDDLDVMSATVTPDEADSPLVVDPYAVLFLSVSRHLKLSIMAAVYNA
jgi:hypothetical protein